MYMTTLHNKKCDHWLPARSEKEPPNRELDPATEPEEEEAQPRDEDDGLDGLHDVEQDTAYERA